MLDIRTNKADRSCPIARNGSLMAASKPLIEPWTMDEFLEWERRQPERYEYVSGVVRMMTGGTFAHTQIRDNVVATLRQRLKGGPCRALGEGMKVTTETVSAYPDAYVVGGPIEPRRDVAPPPFVIVEVLSRSTPDFDHGSKWLAYQTISELRYYVLISQDERRVDLFARAERGWNLLTLGAEDSLDLPDLHVSLPITEIYEDSGV